ncbi:MAG TPA: dienelactone hydrolase family protein [Acetobacteraceae bacterium]|jgi:dienelactone hydrolase|nr:dienelactone hydrolase family protein [Acetobacteraceae bacterium]
MQSTDMKLRVQNFVLWAALLASLLSGHSTFAAEPYRMLSPSGAAPHPAVLLVPGCSGFTAVNGINLYDERARELQAAGYAVVFVDYLGRFDNCGHVSHAQVGEDILGAATWTRAQPGIDPGRISVIGWSYGGGGVLAALMAMPSGPPIFAKAVMYYPDCRGEKPWTTTGISALMLMGAIDDVARPALCDTVVKRAPPNTIRTVLYPNSRHSFDMRSLPERAEYPFGTMGYNAEAANASWATALDFLR